MSVPHLPIAEEIAIKWYSQLQPSFYTKFKLASAGGEKVLPIWAESQETILTTTALRPNNNKTTWLELAELPNGGKRGSSWATIKLDQIQRFKPTRAKWVAKRYPTRAQLKTWLELVRARSRIIVVGYSNVVVTDSNPITVYNINKTLVLAGWHSICLHTIPPAGDGKKIDLRSSS